MFDAQVKFKSRFSDENSTGLPRAKKRYRRCTACACVRAYVYRDSKISIRRMSYSSGSLARSSLAACICINGPDSGAEPAVCDRFSNRLSALWAACGRRVCSGAAMNSNAECRYAEGERRCAAEHRVFEKFNTLRCLKRPRSSQLFSNRWNIDSGNDFENFACREPRESEGKIGKFFAEP